MRVRENRAIRKYVLGWRGLFLFLGLLAIVNLSSRSIVQQEGARQASLAHAGQEDVTEVLIVNSDPTDPGVPLDLALTVRLFAKERLLEITAQVGKHPSYPATRFFDKDVNVQIQLPAGLQLQEGSLSWQGDLQGEEIGQFQAKVKAVQDMEGAIDALAIGYAAVGGRVDADPERFYVLVTGGTIRISLDPFTTIDLSKPGIAEPKQ